MRAFSFGVEIGVIDGDGFSEVVSFSISRLGSRCFEGRRKLRIGSEIAVSPRKGHGMEKGGEL